jgi:hypothetical protein
MDPAQNPSWISKDPRNFQIGSLLLLYIYGLIWLDFPVSGFQTVLILTTTLLMQWVCVTCIELKI